VKLYSGGESILCIDFIGVVYLNYSSSLLKPVLLVTCKTNSDVLCEHEIGNVLFIRDPDVRVEKTIFTGVLLVYSNLDVNTAYRVASSREYGFVESIIPIQCTLTLPINPTSLRGCLAEITSRGARVKLRVRARGVRGVSSRIYSLVVNILRELGVTVESSSSTCLFVEVIESNVYIGMGSCRPVFKVSIIDS
jgi:tRNA acetyltransferase TAN1